MRKEQIDEIKRFIEKRAKRKRKEPFDVFNELLLDGELEQWFGKDTIGLGLTLQQIGYIFGLSRERVRQIESSGLRKLNSPRISKPIRLYLEK